MQLEQLATTENFSTSKHTLFEFLPCETDQGGCCEVQDEVFRKWGIRLPSQGPLAKISFCLALSFDSFAPRYTLASHTPFRLIPGEKAMPALQSIVRTTEYSIRLTAAAFRARNRQSRFKRGDTTTRGGQRVTRGPEWRDKEASHTTVKNERRGTILSILFTQTGSCSLGLLCHPKKKKEKGPTTNSQCDACSMISENASGLRRHDSRRRLQAGPRGGERTSSHQAHFRQDWCVCPFKECPWPIAHRIIIPYPDHS